MENGLTQDRKGAAGELAGANVLILEDQLEVGDLLEAAVKVAGGDMVTKVTTVDEALSFIRENDVSAAIITMIAGGIYTDIVARELLRRDVPFVVTTGIGTDPRHPELHAAPTIFKPFQGSYVHAVLIDLLDARVKPVG